MKVTLRSIDQLTPADYNPRKLSDTQFQQIQESLETFGFVDPIIVNVHPEREGVIVGGHQRVKVAKAIGITEVPTVEVCLPEEKERELNVRLNKASGEWDWDKLAAEFDLEDLMNWGFDKDELSALDLEPTPLETDVDADPQLDKADELCEKWQVEPGQLWKLGNHRLLCGDSTNPDDVARCLDGATPLLMVTDPPYGVEYDPSWRADAGLNQNKDKMGKVENDHIADWTPAWKLFPGDVAYVYHAGVMSSTVQASLESCDFNIRAQIIWAKDRMALSRGDYHWQHEPCWYAVRKGGKGHRTDDRTQTTLWEIPSRDDAGHGHGTQKPLECMARPIRNHSSKCVYEPFSGSGTTIIACERLDRHCRAIEINPPYVAVALQRWADATGNTPELIGGAL